MIYDRDFMAKMFHCAGFNKLVILWNKPFPLLSAVFPFVTPLYVGGLLFANAGRGINGNLGTGSFVFFGTALSSSSEDEA